MSPGKRLIAVLILAACARSVYVDAGEAVHPTITTKMAAEGRLDDEEAAKVRAELISPAATGFRPSKRPQEIGLRLTLEKESLHAGATIRYRLELINEGSKPFVYAEDSPSFFKTGRMSDRLRLILTEPGGREIDLRPPFPARNDLGGEETRFPAGWSNAQKEEWLDSRKQRAKSEAYLYAKLAPGEVLRTRGDGPQDIYRTLRTRYAFGVPGTYELRAVLDGRRARGTVSNSVRLKLEK